MTSLTQDAVPLTEGVKPRSRSLLWDGAEFVRDFLNTATGRLVLFLIVAFGFCFWPLLHQLPKYWFDGDSYFTHGVLVPFLVIYILYEYREKIASTPVKPFLPAALPLAFFLYIAFIAARTEMTGPLTYDLILCIFLAALTIGGWKMTGALAPALLFSGFALPFGQGFLDQITYKFQGFSTDVCYELLKLFHVGSAVRTDPNQIIVGNYDLYVAGACSGLKLTISVTAFVALFIIVGRLRWWANLILVATILPLCILINGIRIAMIGAVGCYWGEHNAAIFHDWSGYISILLCFFLLMKLTRTLGWN
jgi:exosortase